MVGVTGFYLLHVTFLNVYFLNKNIKFYENNVSFSYYFILKCYLEFVYSFRYWIFGCDLTKYEKV